MMTPSISYEMLEKSLKSTAEMTEAFLDRQTEASFCPAYRRQSEQDVMTHPSVLKLKEAMRYSLLAGGKRIRPYLVISFCRMFGGEDSAALPLAGALEMIHTYSLIHDDLPSVDNDDLRRGRPTSHVVFGEAGALFAGDALLTMAFAVAASAPISAESRIDAIRILAECAGEYGMLGGQMADIAAEHEALTETELCSLHGMKTGALMRAAVRLGCLAAGVSDEKTLNDVDGYASDIGLSFQIIDDILDRYGDVALLGKNVNSDLDCGKNTFLSFYSREGAMARAEELTERAIATISAYPDSSEAVLLARYLLSRNK